MDHHTQVEMLDVLNDIINKTNQVTVTMMHHNGTKDEVIRDLIRIQDSVREGFKVLLGE